MAVEFEPVIGFEVHTELATESKVFCGCATPFGAPPNTQVCPVCLGMPGVLPVLNRKAFEFALKTALALHCTIPERCHFDRKNYYYPDLPKNYQISQNYRNLGTDGWLEFPVNSETRRVGIHNIHLEEDAGKNVHSEDPRQDYSLVDLNRAGTPLLEIVTQPDLRSKEEADAFMRAMRNLLLYLEVSDCKMQEGRLRFELNISVRKRGETKLGTKVEIKNLNSISTVLKCIDYEYARQVELILEGGTVDQETRLWDEAAAATRTMRSKETAKDYRYFPEPDLVEVHVTEEWKSEVAATLPELPAARRKRFAEQYELPDYDATILTAQRALADYFEDTVRLGAPPKQASNWIMTEMLRILAEQGEDADPRAFTVTPKHLAALIRLIEDNTISGKIAKQIYPDMLESGKMPDAIVKEKGLVQISDAGALESIVDEVIAENPSVVEDFRGGKQKAIGFLIGQAMKKSKGKANPQGVQDLLRKKILG
jgi:aspartyl-tRNA(Asn)/glutamyl-tRNA(Gln) amidotransferase subunit B